MNGVVIGISVISLLISILGIFIAIYTFIKTNRLSLSLHDDTKGETRINAVVFEYRRLYTSSQSSNISALIQAGMSTLQNESEAKEAIKRIATLHAKPLSPYQKEIEEVGILRFFQNITFQQYNIPGKFDEIISELRRIPKIEK